MEKMKKLAVILLFVVISVTGQSAPDDEGVDYSDYSDDYDDEDYAYDDDETQDYSTDPEYDESKYPYTDDYNYKDYGSGQEVLTPTAFATLDQRVLVDKGNTARLQCGVDNLGGYTLFWKKLKEDNTQELLAMGDKTITEDQRISVEILNGMSTLTVALVEEKDIGTYLCEVSTSPVMKQEHRIEMRYPARVEIETFFGDILIRKGEPLQLNCKGFGDPMPDVHWYREYQLLPDGSKKSQDGRLHFDSVGEEHEGTYTCSGYNGFGTASTQSVAVVVEYSPEVYTDHAILKDEGAAQIICVAKGYPEVRVSWSKNGGALPEKSEIVDAGNKHTLTIPNVDQTDLGVYTCHGKNSAGKASASLDLTDDALESLKSGEDDQFDPYQDTVKSVDELLDTDAADEVVKDDPEADFLEHNLASRPSNSLLFLLPAIFVLLYQNV